jgi:hypothetical protein
VNAATGTPLLGYCPIIVSTSPIVATWQPCGEGLGPVIVGVSDVTNQTISQSTVTIVASAAVATGKYRISYYANENNLCSTGFVTVLFTFSWFDPSANRTAQSLSLTIGVTQSAAAGSIQGVVPIFAQASTAITYTSTVTGTCTIGSASYDIHATVEAL